MPDPTGPDGLGTDLWETHADWWIAELERIDARQPTWELLDLRGRHVLDLRAALDWLEPDQPRRYRLLALVALVAAGRFGLLGTTTARGGSDGTTSKPSSSPTT